MKNELDKNEKRGAVRVNEATDSGRDVREIVKPKATSTGTILHEVNENKEKGAVPC